MDKKLAQKLLAVLDYKTVEVLKEYLNTRVELQFRQLKSDTNHLNLMKAQGAIQELENLMKLREHAMNFMEG